MAEIRKEGGVQTRNLREAGVSTQSAKVIQRNDTQQDHSVSPQDQTNKSKPANHGAEADSILSDEKPSRKVENLLNTNPGISDKNVGLNKTRSLGSNMLQTRSRCLKNAGKESLEVVSSKKTGSAQDQLMAEEEGIRTNSSTSINACQGEERANKRKAEDKWNQKNSQLKNKDEFSADEGSNKSDPEGKECSKDKKPNNKAKEKQCSQWLKEISQLEATNNLEQLYSHSDDDIPKYWTNKICPISENKIPKIPKIQNLAKNVTLRKVLFQGHDERWYCMKCLNAHNESLYCYYCGQIYFVGVPDMEDDGKAWILWDDCNKWVSTRWHLLYLVTSSNYHF